MLEMNILAAIDTVIETRAKMIIQFYKKKQADTLLGSKKIALTSCNFIEKHIESRLGFERINNKLQSDNIIECFYILV